MPTKSIRIKELGKFLLLGIVANWLSGCSHMAPVDNKKAKLYLQMATDQLNKQEYKAALQSTKSALQMAPGYPAAYNHLALIYMETKRYKKSEEAFVKALELKPEYPEVFNNYGVLLNRRGKYKAALKQFRKAVADDNYRTPESALTNMGYAYYKLGDFQRAKIYHQKALDIVPNYCLANKNLGDVYAKQKSYKKSIEMYRAAKVHCPLFQESHYKMGLALMKSGKRDVAKTELRKLVDRHKSGPYVDRSNQVLKYLQ